MVSLVVSASLQAVLKYFGTVVPGHGSIWVVLNGAISFAVITLLFAMIFKVLPDVRIAWRDVWVGAATTAFLFTAGKFLIGLYLGQSASISAYGAAGSIVLILLWVYYSAQILFFGAELTQAYANRFGARLEPKPNARWIAKPEQSRAGQKAVPVRATDRKARIVAELREQVESMKAIRREAVLGKRQAHHATPKS